MNEIPDASPEVQPEEIEVRVSVEESVLVASNGVTHYQRLLCCCMGNSEMAERLILYESARHPVGTREELIEFALHTWHCDLNRYFN